jgi:hypothetical protein
VRWRTVILAAVGLLGLVLGLWVLDWWSLRLAGGELHANLRRLEACNPTKCQTWPLGGPLATAVLIGGSVLGVVTGTIGGLTFVGVQLGTRLIRAQLVLALVVLCGAAAMLVFTPDKLSGAGIAIGGWATVVATMLCAASGLALIRGDDPLGQGVLYKPVKVEVPANVIESNVKFAGATIPPFAIAQRAGTKPPMTTVTEPASTGGTSPSWQPPIKDTTHVEAPAPRRSSTRAPYTAPPPLDAARQALRFVVAEATIGDRTIVATLEDHRKLELEWKVFTRASARQLPPGPPFDRLIVVDLCTIGGAPLRFLPSSRVNYADLPGGAAPNSRENLRRLVAHVKTKQATFGVEHDSAGFFGGEREPPALMALKQFVTYDEQYAGVIGTPPPG